VTSWMVNVATADGDSAGAAHDAVLLVAGVVGDLRASERKYGQEQQHEHGGIASWTGDQRRRRVWRHGRGITNKCGIRRAGCTLPCALAYAQNSAIACADIKQTWRQNRAPANARARHRKPSLSPVAYQAFMQNNARARSPAAPAQSNARKTLAAFAILQTRRSLSAINETVVR